MAAMVDSTIAREEANKFTAPDAQALDRFGQAVAISEDYFIVGAHREDTGGTSAGSVYLFSKVDFSHQGTLQASDAGANHFFGWSLAAEGNQVLVGAPGNGSGAAYLFDLDSGLEVQKLLPDQPSSGDRFGQAVAISPNHLLVGAWLEDNNDLQPSEDSGAAYLFDRQSFAQLHRLQSGDIEEGDQFGGSVALTSNRACVGAPFDHHSGQSDAGSVTLFDLLNGEEVAQIISASPSEGDVFGSAIAAQGDLLVVGAPEADTQGEGSGAAFLYQISTATLHADLLPAAGASGVRFGNAVAISEAIIVGAFRSPIGSTPDAGAAHLFSLTGSYQNILIASDAQAADFLGHSVAIDHGFALVGALQDDDDGPSSGSASLFSSGFPALLENFRIAVTASQVELRWQATPGVPYSIFLTEDLSTWPEIPAYSVTPATTEAFFAESGGASASQKFYRVTVD